MQGFPVLSRARLFDLDAELVAFWWRHHADLARADIDDIAGLQHRHVDGLAVDAHARQRLRDNLKFAVRRFRDARVIKRDTQVRQEDRV